MKPSLRALAAVLVLTCFSCNYGTQFSSHSKGDMASLERVTTVATADSMAHEQTHNEEYADIPENKFISTTDEPLSTFSIDVDEASYSNSRRYIESGQLPPKEAVRIEEFINYFDYEYPQPSGDRPFFVQTEIGSCPWNEEHKLVHIGIQGKKIPVENLPPSNMVFLIDVSGSMQDPNKLPLVKESLKLLTNELREKDRVAIVAYAGSAGLVLPSTNGMDKMTIRTAIGNLESGGSTAGGEGILLAYRIAGQNFIRGGNNRVILATDGDFNVGISSDRQLVNLIEEERKKGIFLSVLGYGMGNYKDKKMQELADNGNGNHSYIDNINEARKVLVQEFGSTLFTIAKDVKIQVAFNPAQVQSYRLIGYENRMLANKDFDDDTKDAGELGSGHTVTALYEIVPATEVQYTRFREFNGIKKVNFRPGDLMILELRYKKPDEDNSTLLSAMVTDAEAEWEKTSDNFRFAAAVAEFGLLLRDSKYRNRASFEQVLLIGKTAIASDVHGYRKDFLALVKKASSLSVTSK